MTDPKVFYRELDALLAKIRLVAAGEQLLPSILQELAENFHQRLHIANARYYLLLDDTFVLQYPQDGARVFSYAEELEVESEVVQLASRNRSYIYDSDFLNSQFFSAPKPDYPFHAAIWVHSPERQWLVIFELESGWEREEINLFLNSVRTSLNYRFFSDAIGVRLEQAVEIQKSLLPQKSPKISGYDISGFSQPAELVGGDLFDYFELKDGTLGVSIGDVSGHGLPAALLMRDVVIGLRMGLSMELRTVHTVKTLNRVILRSTYAANYVSLFVTEMEGDGHLFFVNAGHPGPLLVHGQSVKRLAATGTTLGFLPEIDLHRDYAHLKPGGVLVLYSDGITERQNSEGEMFGLERLTEWIIANQHLDANTLLHRTFAHVYEFGHSAAWDDDVTLVVIKRR
ncbi:MAG TPA: PP2C family protein-serine/threonine phosphatase [bacterium]|nr:PP2C family protein-serine/threonine phosphatase [bacterium]HQG46112.1 PP2C family protein-serine/threonine phosphatase [bacterium]HQI50175.1 PP2C family protein-serine/threonine phosphatase [bacterium]HQJ63235.1 PP2C family protein-serine/threonine phosphatase [bacterium]